MLSIKTGYYGHHKYLWKSLYESLDCNEWNRPTDYRLFAVIKIFDIKKFHRDLSIVVQVR